MLWKAVEVPHIVSVSVFLLFSFHIFRNQSTLGDFSWWFGYDMVMCQCSLFFPHI